jgi:hypothetical protein
MSNNAPAIVSLALKTARLARNEFFAWSWVTTSVSNEVPSVLEVANVVVTPPPAWAV